MQKPAVVVTQPVHPEVEHYLRSFCEPRFNATGEALSCRELLRLAADAEGILAFMTERIDAHFLEQCPKLRIVAGALKGRDNFAVEAFRERGVWLTIVPDLLTAPTAELALALLLGVARRVLEGDAYVRSGRFRGWRPDLYGSGLDGSTVGIVGFGAVGRAFAKRLRGFDVRIVYADRRQAPEEIEMHFDAHRLDFEELLGESDIVAPFTYLTAETFHLFDERALARMKPGAILLNCARGSIVDEEAVARALASGHLAGYAADVFEMEDRARPDCPGAISPALLANRRTVFTPHLGSAIGSVRRQIEMHAADQLRQAFAGLRPDSNVF